MTVRLATTADDLRIFRDLVVEYENALDEDLRHPNLERELASLGGKNVAYLAFDADGNAAGCVAFFELNASAGVVKKLYVRPAFRKLGLARAMLERLLELARERGYERVVLDTERDRLHAAYLLYRSMGFTECEPYGEVEYPSPTFMELRIAARF